MAVAPAGDPSAEATFGQDFLKRHHHGKKRVGRPRLNWVDVTQVQFWNRLIKPGLRPENQVDLNLNVPAHVQ